MAHEVIWTKPVLEEFIRLGNLSETEEKVIRLRARDWTRTRIGIELNMSESAVDQRVKILKQKYDECQPYSDILKPRKKRTKTLKQ